MCPACTNVWVKDLGNYRYPVVKFSEYGQKDVKDVKERFPPSQPVITDMTGRKFKYSIGPFNEGGNLHLICTVYKGKPAPTVSWTRDGIELDSAFERQKNGVVRNELFYKDLSRSDLHAEFDCFASNNNITDPVRGTVQLELNLRPLTVQIRTTKKTISAHKLVKFLCQSSGSRPPAVITWWKGNRKMSGSENIISEDNNISTSMLTFIPTSTDNGKYLSCRAENPNLPESALQDGHALTVTCKSKALQNGFGVKKHSNGKCTMITFSRCMHGQTFQDFAADFLTALSEIYADNEILHLVYMRACKKAPSNRFTSKTAQKVMDRLKDIVITSTTMLFLTRIEDGTGITVRRMSEIPVYKVLFGSILVGKTFKSFETELADKLNDIFATEEQPMLISLQIDANEPVITIYTKTTQDVIDRVGLYIVTSKTKFRVCRTDGEDALNTTNTPKEEVEVPEETLPVTDNSTEDMCTLEEALELVDYDDSSVGSAAYKRILENSYYIIMREYRVIKKFDATEITYSLEFKDIWKDLDFADVLVELYNVFENVLRSVTAGLKGYDRIKVYIEHHSLQVPIGVHLMDVSEITADTILDAIERALQSSKQLTFDGTLKIQIGVVRMPVVGGKRRYTYSAQDGTDSNEKHSIVTISKADDMCMARAILLGTAAIRDPKRYKELRYTYRSAQTIAAHPRTVLQGTASPVKTSLRYVTLIGDVQNVQLDLKPINAPVRNISVEITSALIVDPLQYITVASACMAAYKSKFCQELYDIDGKSVIVTGRQFPEGKSGTFIRSYFPYIKASVDIFSAASIRWLSWIAHTKNIKIIHACNEGEYRVPGSRYRLDGFHAETRTAYEFHSCMYHGCLFCYENRGHMVLHLNQTVEELYRLTMLKKQFLLNKGYKYVCLWYHEYDVKRQSDEVFKSFVDNLDVVERLNPRDALYGGRTNAVRLHYKPKVDEKIEYVDFTSLYPYINKTRKYMTCPPVIITRDFQDISNYFGFVKCILLPPRRLLHPLIPYRMGGKLLFPLCKACAEVGLYRKCKCSDADRCLKGTWATVEIQKALTLNYKIVKIYEIWDYPETLTYSQTSKGLFSDYINCFLKFKEESSGYPSTCVTIDEKELYKQQYFEREGVWLDEMCRNEGLRTVAKLSMNFALGQVCST
ncbi:Nephrin [Nymphon striatum]|nr:Nephrin [Nymphon striatum]